MNCASCRDIISADLDGEASPEEATAAGIHLATCAACEAHRERVVALHRAVRIAPADVVPDLTAAILAASPPVGSAPTTEPSPVWRIGLVLVALAQVLAAIAHLGGDHIARDQASWEAALAAGFVWAAWRPGRSAGLLPVTSVLTLLLLVNGGLGLSGAGTHHLLAPVGLAFLVLATGVERPRWMAAT